MAKTQRSRNSPIGSTPSDRIGIGLFLLDTLRKLDAMRRASGLSGALVAERMGVRRQALYPVFTRGKDIRLSKLWRMATACDCSVEIRFVPHEETSV